MNMTSTTSTTPDCFTTTAASHGYETVDLEDGARVYRCGVRHVWRIDGTRHGMWWMSADLVDGAFRGHKRFATMDEALARPTLPASVPLCSSESDRTAWIEAHAAYFTAVRIRGRRNRERKEFDTRAEAEAWARREHSDGRTMIYAVAADGQSAHITNV